MYARRGQLLHGSADASAGKKVPAYQLKPRLRPCMPVERLTGAYRLSEASQLVRNKALQALAQLCEHMPEAGSAPHAFKAAKTLLEAALPHLLALLSAPDAKTGKQVCSVGHTALYVKRQAGQQSHSVLVCLAETDAMSDRLSLAGVEHPGRPARAPVRPLHAAAPPAGARESCTGGRWHLAAGRPHAGVAAVREAACGLCCLGSLPGGLL